ncbi:hypothetical protein KM801_16745, partial [Clostridium tyrobutyricum]|nr:hypothetical protein [Clostridium tyrobutyricum]MBV4444968.1 hypothetical protein [Clostridium tyrobutyricum]
MADIAEKVAWIRQAIEGKDVRESLASGIEAINEETENTTARQGKVEQDFESIKSSEADRIQSEITRKSNEENRVSNENSRVIAENTRIANEETRKENETSRQEFINALKVCEPYDSNKTYVMHNKVTYQGSTYQCIVDTVQEIIPGTDNTKWLLIAVKGQDGTGGDM